MVFFHHDEILEVTGGNEKGEAPAIGSNEERRLTGEPITLRIRRDERGKRSPLGVGQIGGKVREGGGKRGIMCTFYCGWKKRIGIAGDAIITAGSGNPVERLAGKGCEGFQTAAGGGNASIHATNNGDGLHDQLGGMDHFKR